MMNGTDSHTHHSFQSPTGGDRALRSSPVNASTFCGTTRPLNVFQAELVYQNWLDNNPQWDPADLSRNTVQIRTYWHNIQRSDGSEGVTNDQIAASLVLLNSVFEDIGFTFALIETSITPNDVFWSCTLGSDEEVLMKQFLHTGDCSVMNVYSIGGSGGVAGWGSFPFDCSTFPEYDGVVISKSFELKMFILFTAFGNTYNCFTSLCTKRLQDCTRRVVGRL